MRHALPKGEESSVGAAPVWLFAATLFVSASLLFWIQPLFAKMVLPLLGGSPSVWNTAMVFFQAVLLAGYGYAHLLIRQCGQRSQILLHLGLLAVTALALPISVAHGWRPDTGTPPTLWLLGLLGASIGAPFFAVSATAPLLQRWFSHTGHPHAHDPYFLYGASNLGSILALLAFPFALEPLLSSHAQALAWTLGFAVLALGIAGCGGLVWRRAVSLTAASETATRPDWPQRLSWIVYAALPSCLLLSVTTHISTDIAPAPLLWVIPLLLAACQQEERPPLVIEVTGDEGDMSVDYFRNTIHLRSKSDAEGEAIHVEPAMPVVGGWPGEAESVAEFLDAVEKGTPNRTDGRMAARLYLTGLAIERSKDTGGWVEIEDVAGLDS